MRHFSLTLPLLLLLCSCSMQGYYARLDSLVASGNCTSAVPHVEKNESEYGQKARLLYLMDAAMVNLMCRRYEAGNMYFHEAETLGEELWTKSISQFAISMVTNDLAISYPGEDFERALINLFSAVCYLKLDQYDEALVECRRLDTLLSGYNAKYRKKNVYKEDAFGRYLSGIIHESAGEFDDAYIDYAKAWKIYQDYYSDYGTPAPLSLAEDLLRTAEAVDRIDDARSIVSGSSRIDYLTRGEVVEKGKIVLIHFNGKSPVKVEKRITVPTLEGPISIAFPEYVVQPITCRSSSLVIESGSQRIETRTALAEDINEIAVKSLADRKARIWAKTIARAVAKQAVIIRVADQQEGDNKKLAKFLLNTVNTLVVERADTRTWRTLPGAIYIGRAYVPQGGCKAFLRQCGQGAKLVESISIRAGETKYVIVSTPS